MGVPEGGPGGEVGGAGPVGGGRQLSQAHPRRYLHAEHQNF